MYTNKYLLSKYRPQLMGVAICMIMGFHTGIIPWGDLGVEWFYILSGLGLYYSLSKKPDLLHFYKKRFIRIIPTYLMLVVPTAIIFQDKLKIGILSTIFQYDTILGNMGYMTWWFLVLLLLFYVVAPVIFRWGAIMLVISLLIFLYSLIGNMDIIPFNKMFINRLPIVLVSIPLGEYI